MKIVTDHNQISSHITTYFHHRKGLENKRSGTDDQCHLHYMLIPSPEHRVSVTEKMARLTHVNAITITSLNTFQTNINTFFGHLDVVEEDQNTSSLTYSAVGEQHSSA
jgi:hypothetical protein